MKLNNGFDLHIKFLVATDYVQKIAKKRFPLNYSLETEIFEKVLQSDNGECKRQDYLEESEADYILFELF